MISRMLRRFAWSLLVIWSVITLTFIIHFGLPGDPARAIVGPQARPAEVEKIRAQLGLDKPLLTQYGRFISRLVHLGPAQDNSGDPKTVKSAQDKEHRSCTAMGRIHFDLGMSYQKRRPVLTLLLDRLPNTALLAVVAVYIQLLLGVVTGMIAALKHRTWVDMSVVSLTLLGVSAPTALLGVLLQYVLAYQWQVLPFDGAGKSFSERMVHILLPALTLGIYGAAYYTRLVRDEVLTQRTQDYVRTAIAKGASRWRVMVVHVLRNTLMPVVTAVGLDLGALLGGAIVTEKLFRWPGIGALSVDAVIDRDAPVVLGCVLVAAVSVVISSLLVDVSYVVLEPRARR